MPKRSSKRKKRQSDANQIAASILKRATSDEIELNVDENAPQKNPAAVALGKLGGKKGGPARAAALSKTERKAIASRAAKARWANRGASDEQTG
jgi:hypothetical protein